MNRATPLSSGHLMLFGRSLTPSSRRTMLVLGEAVVLWLLCIPITSYDQFVKLVTHGTDFLDLNWKLILVRSALIPLACQVTYSFHDLYDFRITSNRNQTSIRLLQSIFYAGILLAVSNYGLHTLTGLTGDYRFGRCAPNPWSALAALVVTFPVSYSYRLFFHWMFARWQFRDRVLLLGNGAMARTLEDELQLLSDPGHEIVGYVGNGSDGEDAATLEAHELGSMDQLAEVARQHRINLVAVAMAERRGHLPTLELLNCRLAGIRVEEGEQLYERLTGKIALQRLRPSYLIFSEGFQRSKTVFAIKRIMDILLSIVGLILLFPLCFVVAVAIKIDSRGPIFYGQSRVGKEGRVFTAYKFRSMTADAEKGSGPQWAAQNDSRITRVGGLLRRTRIDEIPQMWNVLKNEMSFVGPRPERPFFVDELRKEIPYYMERLLVKPGITGWAQINYQYGNTIDDALTKLQYDLYYIKNLSIYLDLVTLLGTIKVVVLRRGAV